MLGPLAYVCHTDNDLSLDSHVWRTSCVVSLHLTENSLVGTTFDLATGGYPMLLGNARPVGCSLLENNRFELNQDIAVLVVRRSKKIPIQKSNVLEVR